MNFVARYLMGIFYIGGSSRIQYSKLLFNFKHMDNYGPSSTTTELGGSVTSWTKKPKETHGQPYIWWNNRRGGVTSSLYNDFTLRWGTWYSSLKILMLDPQKYKFPQMYKTSLKCKKINHNYINYRQMYKNWPHL